MNALRDAREVSGRFVGVTHLKSRDDLFLTRDKLNLQLWERMTSVVKAIAAEHLVPPK